MSLFLIHTIWPFLWIWTTLYKPERGWGLAEQKDESGSALQTQMNLLEKRITELEDQKKAAEMSYAEHLKQISIELAELRKTTTKRENI